MAVLRVDRKNLEGNKRLNKSANYLEISCFRGIKILCGILKEPLA